MTQAASSKGLNYAIWTAQFVLGAMFLMAGIMKVTSSIEDLHLKMSWTLAMPDLVVRFIGTSELLGALGLLLPSLLRIRPSLTPLAALGLALVQILAAVFHISRGEFNFIGINAFMAAVAIFIWWGRAKKVPIMAKQ